MRTLTLLAGITGIGIFAAASSLALADGRLSGTSTTFVQKAAMGGEYEIQASRIALQRSQNANVKQFAQQMVDDHSKSSDELKSALQEDNVDSSVAATALDADHQKMLDKLKNDSASDFDQDYVNQQTDAHKETVRLFAGYAQKGDDDALKEFAVKTLPTLRNHLQHVKQLKANS